jgi:hypothetical protein
MAPYVEYYTGILEQSGIFYDIISWDRLGIEETGVHAFKLKSDPTKNMLGKIIDYRRYYDFVKTKLMAGNYNKVVVFTILNTLLLFPLLKKKYRRNYIFDIRDCSVTLKYLRPRMRAAVQNAAMVVISSPGFKQWLPKDHAYVIRHNTSGFSPEKMLARIKGETKYRILTIGALRDFEANKALVEQLKGLSMFTLEFVGTGSASLLLRDLVANQEIKNVNFSGRYTKQDEPKYLEGISLINILTNNDINSMTLMSNRFYLSIIYGIPMIVSSGTEQARWVEKYDLGVVIDRKSGIKKQILQYLMTFNPETFDSSRKACLRIVQQDNREFEDRFKSFLAQ